MGVVGISKCIYSIVAPTVTHRRCIIIHTFGGKMLYSYTAYFVLGCEALSEERRNLLRHMEVVDGW